MRKVIVYIAASVDGYIARPDGNIDWLSMVETPGEDYGYQAFTETIDTVIMGRKTYEKVLSFGIPYPHTDKQNYIITQTLSQSTDKNIQFYAGDLTALITQLKQQEGKNIFIDGGAQLVHSLLEFGLIDEIIVSTVPVMLGGGIRLFREGLPEQKLKLMQVQSFKSGLVQVHYTKL
ncbi:MAG: dihydrofolate reductase family protein [Bacteroidota bacterium]